MSWYVHPSRQLRDDELPPELVVTNRDGSIVQAYVPYDATGEQLEAENTKLRELAWRLLEVERIGATSSDWREIREQARELGVDA